MPEDPEERAAREQELRALYASAWRQDVPEEDRLWAAVYRETCTLVVASFTSFAPVNPQPCEAKEATTCTLWVNHRRRRALAQSAYEAYLRSGEGRFDGAPGRPWNRLSTCLNEPWCAFVDRIEDAPEGESELATAEAATWEYWDALYRAAPPWDSDPDQAHWLAAVRAVRAKALADEVPPENGR